MADEEFSEVTSRSWFSRIGDSLKGIIVGVVLVIVSIGVLFWNEGRAVRRYQALKEGAGSVISVKSDSVDPSNDGRLVHMSGLATTGETLTDPDFGISENVIKLRRTVEMYQWEEEKNSETRKKLGGGEEIKTTYSYKKSWSSSLIDSSGFKKQEGHENPAGFPHESITITAKSVSVGAFALSPGLIEMLSSYEPLQARAEDIQAEKTENVGGHDVQSPKKPFQGGYYIGKDPAHPEIGDAKVSFSVVRPANVSVVSRQRGESFEPYQLESGETIELLENGTLSADSMFKQAQSANSTLTWILRFVGFFMMLIGFGMILKIISVIGDVLPLLGDLLSVGTGLISLLVSVLISLVTIAVAWLFYRPLLGVLLLLAAFGVAYLIRQKMRKPAPSN